MITKSDLLLYYEAPMHLWAAKHHQLDVVVPSSFDRYLMEQGKEIEKQAKLFVYEHVAGGYPDPEVLWQPTYTDGNYQLRADAIIFDKEAQVYDIYEIKSGTGVKKEHIYDLTFQTLVCEANMPVRDVFLVHLNKDYVRQGEIDLAELLMATRMNEEVEEYRDEIENAREDAWQIAQTETREGIAPCDKPKSCVCLEVCHPGLPDYPIYDINRIGRKAGELRAQGILSIKEVPDNFPLSGKQKLQVKSVKQGQALINHRAIKGELARLQYPLHFLDYETINPSVPLIDGYRPYQHIVFQYSLHVFDAQDSEPEHYEYLATGADRHRCG
jgi:hypothetical protein